MKQFTLIILASCLATFANAQNAEDSIKSVINKMFRAMRTGDDAALLTCFTDSAILQTFNRDRSGLTTDSPADFAKQVRSLPKDSADERITFGSIHIDGPMASVWTPYKFYWNNRFSHCGVNSFQFIRIKGIWKIQYLIDTRRRQGCE